MRVQFGADVPQGGGFADTGRFGQQADAGRFEKPSQGLFQRRDLAGIEEFAGWFGERCLGESEVLSVDDFSS